MAVHGPELIGRRFSSSLRNKITADSLDLFAKAIGAELGSAPPTYLIVFSVKAAEEFLPTLGFDWSRVVHGDQRFLHHHPFAAGDELLSVSEIESYKSLAGNEFISIRTDFSDAVTGVLLSSTWSTLVFRGEQS